jgi:hypothetical protein
MNRPLMNKSGATILQGARERTLTRAEASAKQDRKVPPCNRFRFNERKEGENRHDSSSTSGFDCKFPQGARERTLTRAEASAKRES